MELASVSKGKITLIKKDTFVIANHDFDLVDADAAGVFHRTRGIGAFEFKTRGQFDRDIVLFGIRIFEIHLMPPFGALKNRLGASLENVWLKENSVERQLLRKSSLSIKAC